MIKAIKKFFSDRTNNSNKNRKNYDSELEQFVSRRMSLNNKISNADEKTKGKIKYNILEIGKIFGILQENPNKWLGYGKAGNIDETDIERLIKKRNEARGNKNFDMADQIRDELKSKGIEIEDTANGTIWRNVE